MIWKTQCPIIVLGVYEPVSIQQFSRRDGPSGWLLFSFALRVPSQGSQEDYCAWAAAALGEVIPAPVPTRDRGTTWPFLPVVRG